MGLNHAFLFGVWGCLGEWGGDVGEAVSLRPGETCGEPSARVFGDGSCQPSGPMVSGEKSWLPDEDSNRRWNRGRSARVRRSHALRCALSIRTLSGTPGHRKPSIAAISWDGFPDPTGYYAQSLWGGSLPDSHFGSVCSLLMISGILALLS